MRLVEETTIDGVQVYGRWTRGVDWYQVGHQAAAGGRTYIVRETREDGLEVLARAMRARLAPGHYLEDFTPTIDSPDHASPPITVF